MDARNFVKESGFKVQTENETARRARMARREDIVRKQLLRDPPPSRLLLRHDHNPCVETLSRTSSPLDPHHP